MTVTVFGIRHHGPGCARSLRAALEDLAPDIVLIEGPPEGDPLLPLVLEEGMRPPVALLLYRPDVPQRAAFYPFAEFSPEWQALRYGLGRAIPVRLCDLPQGIQLVDVPSAPASPAGEAGAEGSEVQTIREDPIALLAQAAGYADPELWWEEEIERRVDPAQLFEAILEAMSALRAAGVEGGMPDAEREAQREASMRQSIRAAEREGFARIAVVCGAWHAPALRERLAPEEDAALLSGLERVKVEATWIPWTNFRLSYHSGYGAGVLSPGWYEHLWTSSGGVTVRWLARAAQLLRGERLEAPASSVIDAVRLADTLAALRDRRNPGLQELREAILTTLCGGQATPMQLIRERLEVGDVMGAVPASTPTVPLQRDVERQQRRVRLQPTDARQTLDLDLRKENDLRRSVMLHRLRLLGIPWGTPSETSWQGKVVQRGGTFRERWRLKWEVDFPLLLIGKNAWGNTLFDAADAFVRHEATVEADLPRLTQLLREATVADLSGAIGELLHAVQTQSAVSADTRHLMDAILPLAEVARYGDVRGTGMDQVLPILDGLFERVVIALPGACVSLDEDAAAEIVQSMARVQGSIKLLDRAAMAEEWQELLRRMVEHDGIHALIRGWCSRLLLEAGAIGGQELERLAGLALSRGTPTAQAAAWIEGLLRGNGLVLLQEDGLWIALDGWLQNLDGDAFAGALPLLRRAFSQFQPPERRTMGEKVKRLGRVPTVTTHASREQEAARPGLAVDQARAAQVIPVLARIVGGSRHGDR